jgi:hypothetical protein
MIVSLEAIFLATFVMVSHNRQAFRSDLRAQIDFETNLRSEIPIFRLSYRRLRVGTSRGPPRVSAGAAVGQQGAHSVDSAARDTPARNRRMKRYLRRRGPSGDAPRGYDTVLADCLSSVQGCSAFVMFTKTARG